ncbi:MAG: tRNA-dihydrouridine synthase family protein [Bacteroidales bacterium]|nr:tRNA-dihydrouridine synthase family protein [Bacteroidales bacterium]
MFPSLSDKDCIIGLSPMDDITDMPFRELCKEFGADLLVTEFIASEALNRDAEKSFRKMRFTERQRPIGIQIFGADEDELLRCLEVVEQAEPDFIDINWGCPVRKVAGKGAGSGILQDIPKMLGITANIVKKASLPVTVKTRLAYSADSMKVTDFAEALQDTGIAALAIHGRTKTQMYSGAADWTLIGEVKNNPRMHIPIFGNGDITTAAQALDSKRRYGVDGILIGRGAIGNPWIFRQCHQLFHGEQEYVVSVAERVEVCRRHLHMEVDFNRTKEREKSELACSSEPEREGVAKGERTAIFEMRKHYGAYFKGLFNFKPYRLALVNATSLSDLDLLLDQIAERYHNN